MSAVGDLPGQAQAAPAAPALTTRAGLARALARRPWACALAVAVPLTVAYLIAKPPAADLAAAFYRGDLFARAGYVPRDSGWYAAHPHYVIGYSLLSPPLGALIGARLTMVFGVLASCALFGLIADRVFPLAGARAAAVVFAGGLCAELLSGRVPYDLGIAVGLGSVFALMCKRPFAALALALLTSLASPVAGAFLALVYLAWAVALAGRADDAGRNDKAGRLWRWPLGLTVAALTPIGALSLAFPEGGHEPFAPSSFWPAFVAVVAIAVALPKGPLSERARRALRIGFGLYALALLASFSIETPMGGNAARLGPELAPALLTGVLWEGRRLALCLLAPALLYWQVNTPIGDYSLIAGQASAEQSYYGPLLAELNGLTSARPSHSAPGGALAGGGAPAGGARAGAPGGAPARGGTRAGGHTIVEVPLTATHMEAAYVAGHDGIDLARGWDRQLDTRYGAIFYRPDLSARAYRTWLRENGVAYVALADAVTDYSARAEVALIAKGLPYLREIWRSEHWRLFRVIG